MASILTSQPNIGTQTPGGPTAFFAPTGGPATLISVLVDNAGSAGFLQFWDATSKSDAGAVLLWSTKIDAANYLALDTPVKFARGIYLRLATTRRSTAGQLAADTHLGGSTDGEWLTRHI